MKLEVNIVTTHLDRSPVIVDGKVTLVSGLPEDLCTKMMCLLKMLEHEGITMIFFEVRANNESILFVRKHGEDCTLEVITHAAVRDSLEETTKLLAEHFTSTQPSKLH